jgi:nucleoside-diphosphate-sugar epimerase
MLRTFALLSVWGWAGLGLFATRGPRDKYVDIMHVLLAGADGFIGRHLVSGLSAAGHTVLPLVYGRAAREGELRIDLTLRDELARLPPSVDAVINASGIVDPRVPTERIFAVNLGGTENLVAWARAHRVRHFVQMSSVAAYGPLVLGEQRSEQTPRLGRYVGLPYMRSKARAEIAIERSGLGYSILRPAAVLGAGDSVVSPGFRAALGGAGLPLLPGARLGHLVSLSLVEGLVETTLRTLARSPLGTAVHAVDVDLSLMDLAESFAAEMGRPCNFARISIVEALAKRNDAGFSWLVASARFGQHYARKERTRLLGEGPFPSLKSAISTGLSGLQGIKEALS